VTSPDSTALVPPRTSGKPTSNGPGANPQSAARSRQVVGASIATATANAAALSTSRVSGASSTSPDPAGAPMVSALPRPAAAPGGAGGPGGGAGLAGAGNGGSGAQGTACAALLALLTLILLRLARRPATASVWRSPLPEVSPA
jgi:hypothetical protein